MKKILLGSGSPRRRELLLMMDIDFEAIKLNDVDEVYPEALGAEEVPAYLSRLKAECYRDSLTADDLLITADTVVIIDGEILGKPHSEDEAIAMLRRLSGARHKVITGVSLTTTDGIHTFDEVTIVEFDRLSDADITSYVKKYRPLDKAGSYGIQEWIGLIGIKKIDGCFYNVMGLPTRALYRELKKLNAI
ncbi:MAG: Maf family nucleotide pyrophosphatase [Muribaculaceae bacterium]|nr:Maf family nucleotide pyrophosphatase [Muribaculaceae bacterium]